MSRLAEQLPPAVQEFILDVAQYVAGLDEMIADNTKLDESLITTTDALRTMEEQAAKAKAAAESAGAGTGVRSGASGAGAAAGEEDKLSAAERRAAEAAKLEAEMQADLARQQRLLADASRACADAQAEVAAKSKLADDAARSLSDEHVKTAGTAGRVTGAMNALGKGTLAAAAVFAGYGIKSAADYQTEITRLKTSAGETGDLLGGKFTGNLKIVSDGILKISRDTATSTHELTAGMYMIESAGFHGAAGLQVLRAAAEGARAEGADLQEVGNALTTMMKDYHVQSSQAIPAMNQLIAVVSHGKTTMQDLASSLHSVLPIAASAHLSFAEVGGAVATLTMHGVSAQRATQHLAFLIRALIAPNRTAANEMAALGLSANDLGEHLGQRGLTGTMNILMSAIARFTDKKTGLVLQQTFNKSAAAAKQATELLRQMPPAVQKLAVEFLKGSGNVKNFAGQVSKLPVQQQQMLRAFESAARQSTGFSAALKKNKGAAETVDAALKQLSGGAVGLETALQLTGENAIDFQNNVKAVGAAAHSTGKNVENWQAIQHTFNFQLQQVEHIVETLAIRLGSYLIPKIQATINWFEKHKTVAKDLAYVIGGILALSVVSLGLKVVKLAGEPVMALFKLSKAVKDLELGTKLVSAATKIWTGIQAAFNLVMDANPIMLVVIGIAALVAGVIYAYTHFKAFRDIVNDVFDWLKGAVMDVIHFVEDHWKLIVAIFLGPFGPLFYVISKYWKDILRVFSEAASAVGRAMSAAANWVWRGIMSIGGFFQRLPGDILRAIGNAGSLLLGVGHDLVIGLWNGLVSMGDWLWNQVYGWIRDVIPGPILHALGIASPSKWAHWAGQMVGQGLADGMVSQYGKVADATAGMAQIVTGMSGGMRYTLTPGTGGAPVAGLGAASAPGPVIVQNVTHVHVAGSVVTEKELFSKLQKTALRTNRRNPTNGLSVIPGV